MSLPKHCGMPPLTCNIEELRLHGFTLIFVLEPELTPTARKWRSYMVHCLAKASRHYNEARDLILMQIGGGRAQGEPAPTAHPMPLWNFALAMEDCVTSISKLAQCAYYLTDEVPSFAAFREACKVEIDSVIKLRNQQEHMFGQLAKGETGSGPILVALSADGDSIELRNLRVSFHAVHRLIQDFFTALLPLFPHYAPTSDLIAAGIPQISMWMTMVERGADGTEVERHTDGSVGEQNAGP